MMVGIDLVDTMHIQTIKSEYKKINNFQNFEIQSNIMYFLKKITEDPININNNIISYDFGVEALE